MHTTAPSHLATPPIHLRRTWRTLLLLMAAALAATLVLADATPAQAAPAPATGAAPAGTLYQPADPRRVMPFVELAAGGTHTLTLTGVPAGATAVALNVTATRATARTYVSACAGGTDVATCRATSALNAEVGLDTPSSVIVRLGGTSGNQVTFYNNRGTVQLAADLQGYFVGGTTGSAFVPTSPSRVLPATPVGPGATTVFTLDAPAGATAAVLNVTAARASRSTFVSACPAGQALSTCKQSSALNPRPGLDLANRVVVKLGGTGSRQVALYNNTGTVNLMADVQGYFIQSGSAPAHAARFVPSAPTRVLAPKQLGPGGTHTLALPGVPTGATAVALNVTTPAAPTTSFVSACPGGTAVSLCARSSVVNPRRGADVSNGAVVQLGGSARDRVLLYNNAGSPSVIADLQGYFVAPSAELAAAVPVTTAPRRPDSTNTGVPAGTTLRRHDGDLVITTPGTVIDRMDVRGFVDVRASGVVIKNSVIRGRSTTTTRALVTVGQAGYSVRIEDSTLAPLTASPYIDGIRGMNITARRVNVHRVIDQVHIYGNNVTIEDSWLHSNAHFANDPNWGGKPSHDDNVQIQRGDNIVLRNNSFSGSHSASIMLTQDQAQVSNLTIRDNFLDGGACVVNIKNRTDRPAPHNVTIWDNTFGRNAIHPNCGMKVPNTSYVLSLQRNFFTDGKVVPRTP